MFRVLATQLSEGQRRHFFTSPPLFHAPVLSVVPRPVWSHPPRLSLTSPLSSSPLPSDPRSPADCPSGLLPCASCLQQGQCWHLSDQRSGLDILQPFIIIYHSSNQHWLHHLILPQPLPPYETSLQCRATSEPPPTPQ